MIQEAKQTERLSLAQASKLYGLLNFLEVGMFGRVGCGGLRAIKDRQYSRETILSPAIQSSFDLILTALATKPKKTFWLTHRAWSRLFVASLILWNMNHTCTPEKLLLQTSKRSCLIG